MRRPPASLIAAAAVVVAAAIAVPVALTGTGPARPAVPGGLGNRGTGGTRPGGYPTAPTPTRSLPSASSGTGSSASSGSGSSAGMVPAACSPPVATWGTAALADEVLMVGGEFADLAASTPAAAAGVGGFVLFGQPPAGAGPSIRSGIGALASDAAGAGRVVPWFSTDEEGGPVQRLAGVTGVLPSPRQMAAQWTPAQVQAEMAAHGRAMRALGITMDLAPVLGVAPTGDPVAAEGQRSFSPDPQVAAAYGVAYQAGLRAAGVVPVAKHFPGLGHASADTDQGPATDPPLSALQSDDLVPFGRVVAAGVPAVMVGHPVVPGLTDGLPASLSPAAYRYLRVQLHFGGVTMTDDLGAGAVSAAGYSQPAAAVSAVEAGADMAMIDAAAWSATVAALQQAMVDGALPRARVEASVGRILAAKGVPVC